MKTFLDSLLDAIIRLDGDALVMHVGEKPYVTTSAIGGEYRGPLSWGQVELSTRPMTVEALLGMLGQILPEELQSSLAEIGAIEHEIESPGGAERFILTAARGGDDVWVEVRRRPVIPERVVVPEPVTAAEAAPEPAPPQLQASVEPSREPAPESTTEPEPPLVLAADEPIPPAAEAVAASPDLLVPVPVAAVTLDVSAVEELPQFELVEEEPPPTPQSAAEHAEWDEVSLPPGVRLGSDWGQTGVRLESDPSLTPALPAAETVAIEVPAEPVGVVPPAVPEPVPAVPLGDSAAIEPFAPEPETLAAPAAPEPVVALPPPAPELVAVEPQPTPEPVVVAPLSTQDAVGIEPPAPELVPVALPEPAPEPIVSARPATQPVADAFSLVSELVAAAPPPHMPEAVAQPSVPEPIPSATSPVPEPVAVAPAPTPPPVAVSSVPEPLAEAPEAAVVVPLGRPALKLQPPPSADMSEPAPAPPVLVDMLQKAAARGAATAYAVAGSRPFVRVEGEVVELGMEPVVTESDIERFMFEFAPRNDHGDTAAEWVFSLADVGRVRVVAFDDEAGPGLVLHIAANVSTAEQIGLSHEAQKLCSEADGLVIVTGRRRNGKSTLLGAFVDLINRRRTDYVVTIESRIRALYERRHALISQREVEGDGEAIARAARAALREGPDVLVLDDIRAPEAVAVALDAARSGRLVIAAIAAPSAAAAIDRLIDGFPTDRRPQVRALLASSLRGVVSQVLVEKKGGGRVGAREVLLGTPAVCRLVLDGATAQLGVAMESAARAGMRTLPQALAALVRDGVVEAEEAYRHVPDQRAFLLMLQRESIDVADSGRRA